MTDLRIRLVPGCRVPLPAGGATLDGLAIPPGSLLTEEGAVVARSNYVQRRLDDGDVELIEDRPAPRRRAHPPAEKAKPAVPAVEPGEGA